MTGENRRIAEKETVLPPPVRDGLDRRLSKPTEIPRIAFLRSRCRPRLAQRAPSQRWPLDDSVCAAKLSGRCACFRGLIEFQQEMSAKFSCGNDWIWWLRQIVDRVLNRDRFFQYRHSTASVTGSLGRKCFRFLRLQGDD